MFEIFTKANRLLIKLLKSLKYVFLLKKLGIGFFIRNGVKISGNPKRITIGYRFQVYENCFLGVSKQGLIELGNDVLLSLGRCLNAGSGKIKWGIILLKV